jgi:hypothetical protein
LSEVLAALVSQSLHHLRHAYWVAVKLIGYLTAVVAIHHQRERCFGILAPQ